MTSVFSLIWALVFSLISLTLSAPNNAEFELGSRQNSTESREHNVSSEFVFSPEREYVNDKEIEEMLRVDSRGPEVAPFETEERLWGTSPPPDSPWKKLKKAVKKVLRLDKTTEKLPWNVTRERHGDWVVRQLKTFHNYIRYTVFNRPTPNVTQSFDEVTADPLDFWRQHYTDWKFFNKLHFEIMNASNPDEHWFWRTMMVEGYGENLDDFSTTTPLYFDINRMTGFSTNVTLPPTTPEPESVVDSAEFPEEVRKMLTMRPAFHKAIDHYLAKMEFPTLPLIEDPPPGVTSYFEGHRYKAMRDRLASFYYITTRDPEEYMDTHEIARDKKLKKHLAKMEQKLLDSISREIKAYTMYLGSTFEAFYDELKKITSTESALMKRENADKSITQTKGTTRFVPADIKRAFASGSMVNVTILEKWLYAHCSNNTLEWATEPPMTRPSLITVDFTTQTERTKEQTGSTRSSFYIPDHYRDQILSDNFTIDKQRIEHMFAMAQKHMRNMSMFKIEENYKIASKAMYEAQFTTTPASIPSEEIMEMFTHKIGTY